MLDPNDRWDSPKVVTALRREHRTNQLCGAGALVIGLLLSLVAILIVVGSLRHGEYSSLLFAPLAAAVAAYFLHSARVHFRSL